MSDHVNFLRMSRQLCCRRLVHLLTKGEAAGGHQASYRQLTGDSVISSWR